MLCSLTPLPVTAVPGYKLWLLLLHGVWGWWVISALQNTTVLKRLIKVTRLGWRRISGKNHEEIFYKYSLCRRSWPKQAQLTPQRLHLHNPGGNHAGLGTDCLRAISARCHQHRLPWPSSWLCSESVTDNGWKLIYLFIYLYFAVSLLCACKRENEGPWLCAQRGAGLVSVTWAGFVLLSRAVAAGIVPCWCDSI